MLTKARWFLYGAAAAIAATVLFVTKVRAMRESLDAHGVVRVGVNLAADGIEATGRRLQRSAIRIASDGSARRHG